jgi:hypothetical protein
MLKTILYSIFAACLIGIVAALIFVAVSLENQGDKILFFLASLFVVVWLLGFYSAIKNLK